MRITIWISLLCISGFCSGQHQRKKIQYIIKDGLQITGVDETNPVIYDNDLVVDTPEVFYLWLKANKRQINLVGNISTRDMYGQPDYEFTHDQTFSQWTDLYDRALKSGLRNIPAPVKGANNGLTRPGDGIIEKTKFQTSAGSDLIIKEAHKASAEKPLCIFAGGNVTTIAHAYLKDNSIADKILVFHVAGYRHNEPTYNSIDTWSTYIVMKKIRYINWSGDLHSWYDPVRPLIVDLTGMPLNPFTELVRYWSGAAYAVYKDIGDAPPAVYFFNHFLWKNVVMQKENGTTGSPEAFDYLLVSENDWPGYGKILSDYIKDPANYIGVAPER